jgi:hypothetical protein
MKKILLPGLVAFSGLFIACEDTGPTRNVSKCMDTKIELYPPICGEGIETTVDEYLFQNELVYVFDYISCCCDYHSPVLNSQCDTLGFLHGFEGNTEINGEDFSNAEYLRTVWP